MLQLKITEQSTVAGLFCVITRTDNTNQRYTVTFAGTEVGRFRTRARAKQFSERHVAAFILDLLPELNLL